MASAFPYLFARQGYGSHQIGNVALKVVDSLFLVQQRIADVVGVGVATLQVVELPLNILGVPSICLHVGVLSVEALH